MWNFIKTALDFDESLPNGRAWLVDPRTIILLFVLTCLTFVMVTHNH